MSLGNSKNIQENKKAEGMTTERGNVNHGLVSHRGPGVHLICPMFTNSTWYTCM